MNVISDEPEAPTVVAAEEPEPATEEVIEVTDSSGRTKTIQVQDITEAIVDDDALDDMEEEEVEEVAPRPRKKSSVVDDLRETTEKLDKIVKTLTEKSGPVEEDDDPETVVIQVKPDPVTRKPTIHVKGNAESNSSPSASESIEEEVEETVEEVIVENVRISVVSSGPSRQPTIVISPLGGRSRASIKGPARIASPVVDPRTEPSFHGSPEAVVATTLFAKHPHIGPIILRILKLFHINEAKAMERVVKWKLYGYR